MDLWEETEIIMRVGDTVSTVKGIGYRIIPVFEEIGLLDVGLIWGGTAYKNIRPL